MAHAQDVLTAQERGRIGSRDPGHENVYASYDANRRRKADTLDFSSIPGGPTVSHLDLDLTLACNLRCTYCFKVKDNEHQDLQIALDAITWLIYASGHASKLTVAMIGGEPTMRFDVIKQLVPFATRRAAQHGKTIHFSVTTNGTLASDELVDFFRRWGIGFHTSIDGHPEVQDRHRRYASGKGSSSILAKTLPKILAVRPDTCARSTVMPDTACEVYRSFEYFLNLGYRTVAFVPANPSKWDDNSISTLAREFDKVADRVIDLFREGFPIKVKYIDEMCEARAEGRTDKPHPCGVGRAMMLADINGDLWPCHRWNKLGNEWKLGSLYSPGTNVEKRREFLQRQEQEECPTCIARPICGGGCPAENLEETGFVWKRHEMACRLERVFATVGNRVFDVLSAEKAPAFMAAYPKKEAN